MKWYNGKNRYFVNPYNFVPVNINDENRESIEIGKHTGYLQCELITKTPLAVPDIEHPHHNENNKDHIEYDFLRLSDDRPVIPGSSLRGVIRSMYETLTDSCFVTANKRERITYRTNKAFKPGLIIKENGQWNLYDAVRYIFKVNEYGYKTFRHVRVHSENLCDIKDLEYGQLVYFSSSDEKFTTSRGYKTDSYYITNMNVSKTSGLTEEGYLCVGSLFNRKHFESVFKKGSKKVLNSAQQDNLVKAIDALDDIVDIYNNEKINIKAKGGNKFYQNRGRYKNAKENTPLPIWYYKKNDNIYFSVANIGRAAYNKNYEDLINKKIPCDTRKELCPACRLFGMVGTESLGSRIRITDAVCTESVPKKERVPLKELSSPKISYIPFYLRKKGDGDQWSYDNDDFELRGRKIYWHDTEKSYIETDEKKIDGDRNASMELLGGFGDDTLTFEFKIFYDGLFDEEIVNGLRTGKMELSDLIWALTLGDNREESPYCYKIGHGKPIGLGSAKIIIKEKVEREYKDGEYTINRVPQNEIKIQKDSLIKPDIVEKVKIAYNLETVKSSGIPVSYPAVVDSHGNPIPGNDNRAASHQWFKYNYSFGGQSKLLLPEIPIANATMKFFNDDKGFGFARLDIGEDVYLKKPVIKDYNRFLNHHGKRVYIEAEQGPKGLIATFCTYDVSNPLPTVYYGEPNATITNFSSGAEDGFVRLNSEKELIRVDKSNFLNYEDNKDYTNVRAYVETRKNKEGTLEVSLCIAET